MGTSGCHCQAWILHGHHFSFRSWLYFVVYVLRFICVSATLILGNVFFLFIMVTIRCVKFTNKYCAKRFKSVQILYVKELCPISAMEVRSLKIFINFLCIKVLQLSCCFYSRIYQWPCNICMVLKSAYIIFLNLSDGCF